MIYREKTADLLTGEQEEQERRLYGEEAPTPPLEQEKKRTGGLYLLSSCSPVKE